MPTHSVIKKAKLNRQFSYQWIRINYFYEMFDVHDCQARLWELLKLALTSEDESGELHERSNMLFFFEHLKELVENVNSELQKKLNSKTSK